MNTPDHRASDDVVFDVSGLAAREREVACLPRFARRRQVYEAVVGLVRARLEKARSTQPIER
ncbi:MAG TPA: hypothetical protein VNJ09_03070, partial [Chthonomonadales bacterium]|nr:hypothetical protein [Chthonomonadales bacterium]